MPSEDGRKGEYIMKRKDCKGFKEVIFNAGRAFDSFGRATSFWIGIVSYRWNAVKQVFSVYYV